MEKLPNGWRSSDEEIQNFLDNEVLPLSRGHTTIKMQEFDVLDRISMLQKWHDKLTAFRDGVQRAVDNKQTENWSDINWPEKVDKALIEVENAIDVLSQNRGDISISQSLYPSLPSGELE